MEIKKLGFPDQFSYCVSPPRRKVVSGFNLGVFASFIVLIIVLFNISFDAPFLNPIFQGFNSSSSVPTGNSTSGSLFSWPFSFSSTTSDGGSTSSSSNGTQLQNVNLMQRDREGANLTAEKGKDGKKSSGVDGEGVLVDKTHVGDFFENVKNGSFTVEEGVQDRTQVDETGKDLNSSSSSIAKGLVWEKTHVENSSESVGNGKFRDGNVTAEKGLGERDSNASFVNANGENVKSHGEEVRASSEMKMQNATISQFGSRTRNGSYGECDIYDGRWVRDEPKPYYAGGSCPYIDRDFDCHLNRRPDDGFLRWKWQPYGCDIPSLNATDFLERLRGKKLVFVGDSLNRNMWESLVCSFWNSVGNKKTVYEISGRREFKKKGFYAFRFEDYNCSVDFVSAPFLVRESSHKGVNGTLETLRLDLMDRTTSMYHDADVLIFNTGHWWTHEKTSRGENYYQEGNRVYPRLKVLEAYKRALSTWARWVDQNIDGSRTQVIFRGYSVTHFRRGEWNSGGQCHKETDPFFNQSHLSKYPSKMRALEHVLREMKTPVIYMNISRLTGYRKDGHPSIYRREYKSVAEQIEAEKSQDCSHWCLPGIPDTWNQLLYVSLLKVGKGSWKIST